jgi:para-nitrobenzyl esterase
MRHVAATKQGRVRGSVRDGVHRFLGIPYAAPPVGPHRFAPPVPARSWAGVRDADRFGPTPPKPEYPPPLDALLPEREIDGEEWLTVNVWTPDPTAGGLPVMVWIHGGAFANGNSAIPVYDGGAFARDGVVLVSVNYRLGVEGFALLPDAPANRGLLDQIAALEWVRDNVAAFGGDPADVTVFGESAGAMSVTTLLTLPRSRGLFTRAITQSGSVQAAAAPRDAALVAGELGAALGTEPTAAALSAIGPNELVAGQRAVRDALAADRDPARFGPSIVAAAMAFIPVVDGDVIPEHPMAAIARGAGAEVALLTGTNTDEYRLFVVPTGVAAATTEESLAGILAAQGVPRHVAEVYRANRPDATPGDLLAALLTDSYFRLPALAVAAARRAAGGTTYVYEFAEPAASGDLGACHGLEVGYVFDNLRAAGAVALGGPDPSQPVADAMHAAWVAFARTGDPGWPAFDEAYPVMVFADPGPRLCLDPRGDERAAWRRPR